MEEMRGAREVMLLKSTWLRARYRYHDKSGFRGETSVSTECSMKLSTTGTREKTTAWIGDQVRLEL
jgi:hypothetical protein